MSSEVWLPVLTGFVGVFVGYLLELDRDRRAYKRDRETRRRDAQRSALLQIQDLVGELISASEGSRKLRTRGLDGNTSLDEREEELLQLYEERVSRARYAVAAQSSRVEDERLNRFVNLLVAESTTFASATNLEEEQLEELRDQLFKTSVATVGLAHELLPDLY